MYFKLERVKKIVEELKTNVYSDRITIPVYQVKKGNYHSREEASAALGAWEEFHAGELWGGRNLHYWFRTKVNVPVRFEGKTIALNFSTWEEGWDATNPQFLLYVDGELIQGLDLNHREVIIAERAKGGQEYQLDLHAYSGMLDSLESLLRSI